MNLAHYHANPAFPAKEPPKWAPLVERWYQLDVFAFALPAAFAEWKIESRPASMLLACPGASNLTDRSFAESGATSPSKFVHTLPNIRSSSLLAVMRWSGPVFTLQQDPFTLSAAFREAYERAGAGEECWVWTVTEQTKVDLFVFGCAPARATHQIDPKNPAGPRFAALSELGSVEILRGFWDSREALELENWVMRRK